MNALSQQRCSNHSGREAVARCPECSRFYCRECVTEHEDRVICAPCLRRLTQVRAERSRPIRQLLRGLSVAAGLLVCWLYFYYLGRILLSVPAPFHEGTIWQSIGAGGE